MHSSRRRHWPVAWSTLIEPGMWPPNSPDLNPVDYAVRDAFQQMAYQCWRFTLVDQLKKAIVIEWGKLPQRLVNRAIGQWRRRLECIIQQQGRHIAHCENCEMWFLDNNWDNKDVVSVVNFLKCVVTKVGLFVIVILRTLTLHKVV